MTIKYINGQLVGYNEIKYIKESDKMGGKKRRAVFLCICGNEFDCIIDSVSRGNTKSCGCKTIEFRSESNSTHGMCKTRAYEMWTRIKDRCYNKNNKRYADWGGRGIDVCEEWLSSFNSFYEWFEENQYKEGLQIDRIDNNKGYSPENCRFTTPQLNSRNKRVRKDSSLGVSGVTFDKKASKYRVRINLDDKSRKNIGFFNDFFEACCARKSAENILW